MKWIHAKQYDVNAFFYISILKPSLQQSWLIEFESWFTCAHRYYQFHCILKTKHWLAFRLLDLYSKMIKYLHNINCLKHQSRTKTHYKDEFFKINNCGTVHIVLEWKNVFLLLPRRRDHDVTFRTLSWCCLLSLMMSSAFITESLAHPNSLIMCNIWEFKVFWSLKD